MFIHSVLFEIHPSEIAKFYKDNRMWAGYAKKAKGFIAFYTMKRLGYKNQYIAAYKWKTLSDHNRFMKKFHDFLVGLSKAKVKLLGRYNLRCVEQIRPK